MICPECDSENVNWREASGRHYCNDCNLLFYEDDDYAPSYKATTRWDMFIALVIVAVVFGAIGTFGFFIGRWTA